jgi:hypothetical protein
VLGTQCDQASSRNGRKQAEGAWCFLGLLVASLAASLLVGCAVPAGFLLAWLREAQRMDSIVRGGSVKRVGIEASSLGTSSDSTRRRCTAVKEVVPTSPAAMGHQIDSRLARRRRSGPGREAYYDGRYG